MNPTSKLSLAITPNHRPQLNPSFTSTALYVFPSGALIASPATPSENVHPTSPLISTFAWAMAGPAENSSPATTNTIALRIDKLLLVSAPVTVAGPAVIGEAPGTVYQLRPPCANFWPEPKHPL